MPKVKLCVMRSEPAQHCRASGRISPQNRATTPNRTLPPIDALRPCFRNEHDEAFRRLAAPVWLACLCAWSSRPSLAAAKRRRRSPRSRCPSDEQLRERLDRAIEYTYANRHLNTKDQAAWQIVHGALVFGRDFQIYNDGQLVKAIDYLLAGGQLRGWNMRPGDHGLEAILEAGSNTGQGHEDQWVGYLSQCGITLDDSLVVGGQTFKVRDLITQAQWDIYDGMEATWTLMAFSTYLPLDAEWTAKDGTKWTIERMVGMEAGPGSRSQRLRRNAPHVCAGHCLESLPGGRRQGRPRRRRRLGQAASARSTTP